MENAVERMPTGFCDQLEAGTDMAVPFPTGFRRFQASGRLICEQLVKKIAKYSARHLTGKIYPLSSNAAVSKLSNLKRPVYGHTSSVSE
jgi:hypothetical protein